MEGACSRLSDAGADRTIAPFLLNRPFHSTEVRANIVLGKDTKMRNFLPVCP